MNSQGGFNSEAGTITRRLISGAKARVLLMTTVISSCSAPSSLLNNDFSRAKTSGFPGQFDNPLFKTCLVQQAASWSVPNGFQIIQVEAFDEDLASCRLHR